MRGSQIVERILRFRRENAGRDVRQWRVSPGENYAVVLPDGQLHVLRVRTVHPIGIWLGLVALGKVRVAPAPAARFTPPATQPAC